MVIMILGLTFFEQSFLNIVTITFSALIIIELLNILSELHKLYWKMVLFISMSILVYFSAIMIFRTMFNVAILNLSYLVKILAVVAISWLPIHLIKILERRLFPSDFDIIMKTRK